MSIQRLLLGLALGLSLSVASFVMANGDRVSRSTLSPNVDANGEIGLPVDFRKSMVHLGSWFVPQGGASGFHDVYTSQDAVEYYRENGVFPDGATLVKELRAASTGDYTTGSGVAFANGTIKQWFVMVKDSKNRFTENGAWGDGWGWALFKTDSNGSNVVSDYRAECLGCHVPVKEKDWVYTEAYPTLVLP